MFPEHLRNGLGPVHRRYVDLCVDVTLLLPLEFWDFRNLTSNFNFRPPVSTPLPFVKKKWFPPLSHLFFTAPKAAKHEFLCSSST